MVGPSRIWIGSRKSRKGALVRRHAGVLVSGEAGAGATNDGDMDADEDPLRAVDAAAPATRGVRTGVPRRSP